MTARLPAPGRSRVVTAIGAVVVVVVSSLVLFAAPASAHAVVVSTNPTDGQVLPQSPETVQIQFSEAVSIELGGLTVLNSEAKPVSDGKGTVTAAGELLSTTVPPDLADGTYVANYRVVSADGHPVSGAIVFGIGNDTTIDPSVRDLAATTSAGLEAASGVARFVTYSGALLAAGLAIFAVFIHDQRGDRRRIDRLTRRAVVVGAVGTIAWIACQAAVSSDGGPGAVFDPSTLRSTLADGLGWQAALSFIGLASVLAAVKVKRLVVAQSLAFYGLLAIAFSFIFWGHARQAPNSVVAQTAIFVHVLAAAVWFGGLVALTVTLVTRRRSAAHVDDSNLPLSTAEVVVRFSNTAAWIAAALLLAGLALTWQEVGSIDALVSTDYGRLVLAKMAVVAVVIALGGYNRYRLVRDVARAGLGQPPLGADDTGLADTELENKGPHAARDTDEAARQSWSRLSKVVRIEVMLLAVAVALTSVLVSVTPARTKVDDVIVNLTIPQGDLKVNLIVVPAKAGLNSMHIQYTDQSGRPIDAPRDLEVTMERTDKSIGPIKVDVIKGGPGHFLSETTQIPVAGQWNITLVGRMSDFESSRTVFTVPIASR